MDRLLDAKGSSFDHLPVSFLIGFVGESQSLLTGVEGSAHVFADPLCPNQPAIIEHLRIAGRINLTHEVKAPSRNGQSLGVEVRDQAPQLRCQLWNLHSIPHLGRRLPLEVARAIVMVVPPRKSRRMRSHIIDISENMARPKCFNPQTVKGLNLVVALGLVDRRRLPLHTTNTTAPFDQ